MEQSFTKLLNQYKRWVINNPGVVTDVETVMTWSLYFVAGKINKSPLVSEFVYTSSKLISLFNDRLIKNAYENEFQHYGLRDQIKLWLTIIHNCEVFIELAVKNQWGNRSKWTVITMLQIFKCSSALLILYRFKELPIQHPPIPSLQRKKFTEGKTSDGNDDYFFKLKRSGRIIRRIDGAPPVDIRDWQPVKINDNKTESSIQIKDLIHAELLHASKPIIHLAAMHIFGTKTWKQWLVALSLDLASLKLYNYHMKELSYDQRLEISRRKLSLVLYLLRSPMYNKYSNNVIKNSLICLSNKIPLLHYICGPLNQYLSHWQDIYFYMWTS